MSPSIHFGDSAGHRWRREGAPTPPERTNIKPTVLERLRKRLAEPDESVTRSGPEMVGYPHRRPPWQVEPDDG